MDENTTKPPKQKIMSEEENEAAAAPPPPAEGGSGGWGGWGFSSVFSDLQKAAAVAAEEISRNVSFFPSLPLFLNSLFLKF